MMHEHLKALRTKNYSEWTVRNRHVHIGFFIEWAQERGLNEPLEITRPVLEQYQRHLFYYRKKNGDPLTIPQPALAPGALARVVQMDDAAELHPAQPSFGDRLAAPRAHAAEEYPLARKRSSRS